MTTTKPSLTAFGLVAAMLAVSAWAWTRTPDIVPVHFGLDGRPDRFGSRAEGLLAMPGVAAAVSLLMAILPRLMPRASRLDRSQAAYVATWMGVVALLLLIHVVITLKATGVDLDITRAIAVGIGVLFAVIGNFLGKTRYNFVMGLRTPWTLGSEAVWDRTHRATAPWVVGGGVLLVLIGLFAPAGQEAAPWLFAALIGLTVGPMLGGTVYSFFLSRRLEAAQADRA